MKKVVLLLMVIMIMVLASCGYGNEDYKTPDESAQEMITNIVVCFENKDKETLTTYFCESTQKNGNLDYEIDEAFEFIDGDIVSYGEPHSGCIGSITDKAYGGYINEVKTEKGTIYKFDFKGMYRYDEDKTQEGVSGLRIINMSDGYDYDNPKSDISTHRIMVGKYDE
ncbi:MAG: DUF5104 domain-containing protein [Ruminococcus sp.]|nr:DUF5104 domain-containing protein [Ruminococcus sp.]